MDIAFSTAADPGLHLDLESHPDFATALRLIGRDAVSLRLSDGARAVAEAVTISRVLPGGFRLGLVSRGPVFRRDAGPDDRIAALRALRRQGVRLVEAPGPEPALHAAGFRQVATAAHVARLCLRGSADDRRRALDPAWRNTLAKAGRAGLSVRVQAFDGAEDHWLLSEEAAQRRARQYRALPHGFTCAFARAHPGQATVYGAWIGQRPVAGMMMLRHGSVATYHIGWTGPEGRAVAAHQHLLMKAADDLAAEGVVRLDLGSVDTESAAGLARFKIGAGARVTALGGSWIAVPGL
jgi:hypothetical protein